jgi:putative FmdB family regulatory protein
MPIYEYVCEKCRKKQEIIQKFGEDMPEICPECHEKGSLKKIVTSSAFHLKGGGWYKDLYSSPQKTEDSSSPENKPATSTTSVPKDKVKKESE